MTAKTVRIYQAECDDCDWIGTECFNKTFADEEAQAHNDALHGVRDVFGALV